MANKTEITYEDLLKAISKSKDVPFLTSLFYTVIDSLPTAYANMVVEKYFYENLSPFPFFVLTHEKTGEITYYPTKESADEFLQSLSQSTLKKTFVPGKSYYGYRYDKKG